ncbi:MAG: Hsp20/alpha crystallin family protein [Actinomycetota bacterium]|nr:Hsp20/alpha crystallin family protein [Actinomycetota bacterium]
MARKSDLLLNFERMWREMDELIGEPWAGESGRGRASRLTAGFSPRVDVYYCDRDQPRAVVLVELAGIDADSVNLEVSGRDLVVSGERAVQETAGRVYQQVEIEAGAFRRVIELGADVIAEQAQASYDDGILRVELPLRSAQPTTRVEIERT